ncbi:MAG: putative Zn-dependent protease [Arenicella sp.]|jgi:predicted Zn-dependent protease
MKIPNHFKALYTRLIKHVNSLLMATTLAFSAGNSWAQVDHFDQLPDLGSNAANFLSDYEAEQLGKAFIRQSRYRLPYVSDPELVGYINRLGNRLLDVSDDAGKDYHFYLIDNNAINAFAVPGGHIAMHTAILTKSKSESELASVVAHEISHVTQSHISRKFENSQYDSWLAIGALLAAAASGSAEAAQAALGVSQASIIDRQLTFSRAYETEADSLGIRLLSRAGFDPAAMPIFFKRLLAESRLNESHAPEFIRSHPLTINRVSESAERVRAYPKAPIQDQSEFLLMQAKATAAYADDKSVVRDLYLAKLKQGGTTLPNRYGYGMALAENGEFDKAREVLSELDKDYPNNVSVRLIKADNELNAGEIKIGLAELKALYQEQNNLGNHLVDIYYANALVLTKNNHEAIPILHKAIADNSNEPYFHILLSRAYGETGDNLRSYQARGEYHYLSGNYEFAIRQYKRAFSLTTTEYERARLGARIEDVEKELEIVRNL